MKKLYALGVSLGALLMASQSAFAQSSSGQSSSSQSSQTEPSAGNSGGKLEEIIVTAQRRQESLQKAALAITAVTGDQLQSRGVTSMEGLGRMTAGLQITPSAGPYSTFTVRGITQLSGNAFADPSVAVNINGVYLASPTAMRGLFYDLERVEVLKGPQGTLYGRNATAGAINIIPKRPKFEFGAEAGVDVGNYNRADVNGAINVPLSSTVAVRVAGQRVRRDGYFSDGSSDENVQALRAQVLFEPSADFSLLLSGDYAHQGGMGAGATLRRRCAAMVPPQTGGHDGNCFVASPYTGLSDLSAEYTRYGFAPQPRNIYDDSYYYGVSLNADWKTDLGTVTFIGGYRSSDVNWRNSAPSWQFIAKDRPRQKSAELRLASPSGRRLQYVLGAYYLDTENHSRQNGENSATPNFSDQFNNLTGRTGALFSQLSYALTDTFRVTGGLRYTYEHKNSDSRRYVLANLVGPDPVIPASESTNLTPAYLQQSASWKRVNWKAGVEWDAGPRNMLYANVSTGFKAGGFFYGPAQVVNGVSSACATNCIYQPEQVTSYVIGSKNRFLDNRLQLNVEAFYIDYKDQQISVVKLFDIGGALSSVLVTDNAGKSRNYGVELEADFMATRNTRLNTQIQYLNSKYQNFSYLTSAAGAPPSSSSCAITPAAVAGQVNVNCSGQPGLRTPKWRVLGSIEQTIPLASGARFKLGASARYESAFQSDVSYIPETMSYATARVDMNLGYTSKDDRLSITAYVDNLTNVVTITSATMNTSYARTRIAAAGPSQLVGVNLAPPRTFGLRAQVKF